MGPFDKLRAGDCAVANVEERCLGAASV